MSGDDSNMSFCLIDKLVFFYMKDYEENVGNVRIFGHPELWSLDNRTSTEMILCYWYL